MRKLCCVLFACGLLCAHGCKKSQPAAGSVSIANPVVKSNPTEMLEKLGLCFKEPSGASDIRYYIIAGNTAQMTFVRNGIKYTARICRQPSFSDISGMYYDWNEEIATNLERCAATVKLAASGGKTVGVCLWYDKIPSCMCSISMDSGATQKLLESVALEVYTIVYV